MSLPRSSALAFAGGSLLGLAIAGDVHAGTQPGPLSPEMRVIDVDEQRGVQIDPGLQFTDQAGNRVELGDYFADGKPVLLTLNYYSCKVICAVQLNGLAEALHELEWTPGRDDFRVVTVSIDPRETAELAAKKQATMLATVGKGNDLDWSFLTGDALNIKALAAQMGVSYAYDKEQDQYAHPAVAMFVAPGGKLTQYLYGLTFNPRDIKFGLMEASEGKLGSPVDQLIMSCFHYDASIGRYGPFAFGMMRLGGAITCLVLGTVLFIFWRREREEMGITAEAES